MQGLGERIVPLISSSLEMIGKIVIAATLVPHVRIPGCDRGGAYCVVYHDHSAIDKDTAYAGLEAENLTVS